MKLYLAIPFVVIGLSSCKWGAPTGQNKSIATDTLGYVYKNFKERAPDCGNKPDSSCTLIKFKYPIFIGQKSLNDTIKNRLAFTFKIDEKADSSVSSLAEHFFDFYKKDTHPVNSSGLPYNLDIDVSVLWQDSSFATLQLKGYTYLGGAHGGGLTSFINWNTKMNKKITLGDIFIDGSDEKLRQAAEKIFRKDEKLSDTASLADGYFFKDNKFALNNNFCITPLGIRFLYNEYEIKPYAAGTTDLFISYTQIKSLLRPNTVVSQYLK